MNSPIPTPEGYAALPSHLKARIGSAQVRAAMAARTESVALHWHVRSALNGRV